MRCGTGQAFWAAAAACLLAPPAAGAAAPMLGFSPAEADAERALEARFDSHLSAGDIEARLKSMASAPNQVGSPHDKANADFVLGQFRAWGWDAHIETFEVLYPTPKEERLELLGPTPFRAALSEPALPGDATSQIHDGALPPYAAYGGDGDVTAELVYVNQGMPDDYKALARMGIEVKGRIVIARYGGGWRGLKPKLAQEHGAVGCILYSDPADDGYGQGDPYPSGATRPDQGVQRGSVLDMPVQPGDPLTPNIGSSPGAPRIRVDQATSILKIPVLPVSWADAQPFLAALGGAVAPKAFRGGLPLTYHTGPGPARVRLVVRSDWTQAPLYDVIAVMRGSERPDEWVIRANHRDGWVFGAWDPLSGQSAMLEEAKAIGALAQAGWRPRRTIVYASWDGEEPGLLGSTEWAEQHAAELTAKAALYVNSDSNGHGVLRTDGSYSTQRLIDQVAAEVTDPETGVSVRERTIDLIAVRGAAPEASEAERRLARLASEGPDLPIAPLGSGSDYSPFVQHLGIASINLEYTGEEQQAGVYHSQYDTFEHYARFGDPGFRYGVALAQTAGRLVLRAADADVAPLQFGDLAANIDANLAELRTLADTMRERSVSTDRLLDMNAFVLASDPSRPTLPPPREDAVPQIDFSLLQAALDRLRTSAAAYDQVLARTGPLSPARRAEVDRRLIGVEHALTDPRGLPGRPWYQHLIYAPGLLTGYGAKTLPGVREAIEGRRWAEAADYIARTAQALDAASLKIDQAAALLSEAP
jgi:N-acetylated-alpha-linked acidic dipeptidase